MAVYALKLRFVAYWKFAMNGDGEWMRTVTIGVFSGVGVWCAH